MAESLDTGGRFEINFVVRGHDRQRLEAVRACAFADPVFFDQSARDPSTDLPQFAMLPDGKRVIWATWDLDSDEHFEDYVLGIGLPMGALVRAWPECGPYPFGDPDDDHSAWVLPLVDWLRDFGERVFAGAPFDRAIIGFEVEQLEDLRAEGMPSERWDGFLYAEDGALQWFPPTKATPLAIIDSPRLSCGWIGSLVRRLFRRKRT